MGCSTLYPRAYPWVPGSHHTCAIMIQLYPYTGLSKQTHCGKSSNYWSIYLPAPFTNCQTPNYIQASFIYPNYFWVCSQVKLYHSFKQGWWEGSITGEACGFTRDTEGRDGSLRMRRSRVWSGGDHPVEGGDHPQEKAQRKRGTIWHTPPKNALACAGEM